LGGAAKPVRVYEGLPEREFAEMIKKHQPHLIRVRELFEQNFSISKFAIGPKILKEKERGDGTTEITYKGGGKVKRILQTYSEARHPWARQALEQGMELSSHAIEHLRQSMPHITNINGLLWHTSEKEKQTTVKFTTGFKSVTRNNVSKISKHLIESLLELETLKYCI
jgi:hypothetical protein